MSAFFVGAYSVDTLEIERVDLKLVVMDASTEIKGFSVTTFNYAKARRDEVRNDMDFIYLKIIANYDYDLVQSNLQLATDISSFATSIDGGIFLLGILSWW